MGMSNKPSSPPSRGASPIAKLDRMPVFYSPLMVAQTDSFSPSAAKPEAAVESWLKLGITLGWVRSRPNR